MAVGEVQHVHSAPKDPLHRPSVAALWAEGSAHARHADPPKINTQAVFKSEGRYSAARNNNKSRNASSHRHMGQVRIYSAL